MSLARNLKAYLKSSDGSYYPLAPKVTTIGKDGCDILLQLSYDARKCRFNHQQKSNNVDQQHAIIEYSDQEDCYVLQDLNTAQGTYVNDVRVQNAAVRLAPGDVIRFGFGGIPYELNIENPPPISYPPVQQRPAWTGSLTLLTDQTMYTQSHQQHQHPGLPYLTTPTLTIPSAHWAPIAHTEQQIPQPRPPLRSRPLSAGSRRPGSAYDRLQNISSTMQTSTPAGVTSPLPRSGGWVTNGAGRSVVTSQFAPPPAQIAQNGVPNDSFALQERDQRIQQLSVEVDRLRGFEMETLNKDQQIIQLQQQLQDFRSQQQQQQQQQPLIMGGDPEVTTKLFQLETEVTTKRQEIESLKEQLTKLQTQSELDMGDNPAQLRSELNEKIKEITNLRNELERVKKDKNITSGLVTQMQRDMSNKDSSISKLTREIEALKKELRERDSQISNMTKTVKHLKEPKTEERDARERELVSLRQKFKTTENKVQEQQTLIDSLREELEKTKTSLFQEKDVQRKLQQTVDQAKQEAQDFERAERVVRVDLEQLSKKNERFRNRVVQTTFSTPGIKAPDTEISDDELLETLKKIIDERTNSFQNIKELENKLKMSDKNSKEYQKSLGDIKKAVNNAKAHLRQNGRLSGSLKEEINLLQSLTPEDSIAWIKEVFVGILQGELTWETEIENALEKCGVNVKLSNDEPSKHIALLYAKWESAISEKERLVKQMSDMEARFKSDHQFELEQQKRDAEGQIADAVAKAKLEVEERLNRAIDDIRAVEAEKLDSAVESERRKIEELQATVEQLRSNLSEKSEENESKLKDGQEAIAEVEALRILESQLREQIVELETSKAEEITKLTNELLEKEKKCESDLESYREQIKQHSVTICAMEDRVTKVMKKNKEVQEEVEKHRKINQELKVQIEIKQKEKPEPPPKPKVIPVVQKPAPDVVAMEQLILVLRKENGEMKKHIQDQDDVILGLRKDLAGASARLSDITGELSEGQKQEVEKYKEMMGNKEREVIEMRQQLAKLSRIIDKQKEELKVIEQELSKEKSISLKYKNMVDKEAQRVKVLEQDLEAEKQEQAKQIELMDHEGRITSEMTSLGAQCRGERHEQVITRQREALSELRSRVKQLEVSNPPLPTQDQALQQVIMLKKELAEMRANQALAEDKNIQSLTSLDREVGRARGLMATTNAEADMERSAHRETMEALEASENSFLSLINAMAVSMQLEGIEGSRPIGHIPKDERERLLRERERACEKMVNQIKVYRERINRKDELLQGYERDLAKLRQVQELADRKSVQVESLANDVRSKLEESQYLRESLSQTRDKLDQEKRLNTAIKQRKTFHLENEKAHLGPTVYKYKPDDPKSAVRKKNQRELLKRKNYEIKTLKTELTEKEKNLFESQNKLYTMQHSQRSRSLGRQSDLDSNKTPSEILQVED